MASEEEQKPFLRSTMKQREQSQSATVAIGAMTGIDLIVQRKAGNIGARNAISGRSTIIQLANGL